MINRKRVSVISLLRGCALLLKWLSPRRSPGDGGSILINGKEDADNPFKTASEVLQTRLEQPHLATGSPTLDGLLGGVEPGGFYLFYGTDGGAADSLIHRLLVNSLRPSAQGGLDGKALYLNCGNYRRSRTILDVDHLFRLMEDAQLDIVGATKRIYALCAFSERQQNKAAEEIEKLVNEDPEIRLVAIQQIAKLFTPALLTPQPQAMLNFQNFTSRMKRLCMENQVILAASCRRQARDTSMVPEPEGGTYLQHQANAIVYLRDTEKGQAAAHLVKHPDRLRQSMKVVFRGDPELGRLTPSIRQRIVEAMKRLHKTYRRAFKDPARRSAFDEIWEAWASEEGAMIYSEVATVMDLLALTAAVDNRKAIQEIRREMRTLKGQGRRE